MSETIDLVDSRDKIIGRTTKERAHKKGQMHRAVHMLVFNSNGELFLQKRSKQMLLCPNKWDSSGAGHVRKGEPLQKAAKRELWEELGIKPKKLKKIGKFLWKDKTKKYWNKEFITAYKTTWNGKIRRNSESSAGKWVSLKEAKRIAKTRTATPVLGIILRRFC